MGLDMTLYERTGGAEEKLHYWRQANAIHGYFVNQLADGVDECQRIPVTLDDLRELKRRCIIARVDPSRREELLPTQSGFFFGPTDYDEYYESYVDDTIEAISSIEERDGHLGEMYYRSSW